MKGTQASSENTVHVTKEWRNSSTAPSSRKLPGEGSSLWRSLKAKRGGKGGGLESEGVYVFGIYDDVSGKLAITQCTTVIVYL